MADSAVSLLSTLESAPVQGLQGKCGFKETGLIPELLNAVAKQGFQSPTPIQEKCIPIILEGRDLLGQAKTGTGKTAAFALPLLQMVDAASVEPQAIILTPTRELALQVAEVFESFSKNI